MAQPQTAPSIPPYQPLGFAGGESGVENSQAQSQFATPTQQQAPPPVQPPAAYQNTESEPDFQDQPAYYDMLPNQPEPEYLILEWLADSRIARKRSREYYSSLAVIVLLLSLILFFANQILLIVVLIAFLFVTYVLASVKPDTVHNMITTYGIRYRNQLFYWQQLGRFWVTERGGKQQLHVEVPGYWLQEIVLLPSNPQSPLVVTLPEMIDLIGRYLVYEEPVPTQIDKWVEWLEERFPLDTQPTRAGDTVPPIRPDTRVPSFNPESTADDSMSGASAQDTSDRSSR